MLSLLWKKWKYNPKTNTLEGAFSSGHPFISIMPRQMGFHAVLAVDVERDASGKVSRLLVQNSWGEEKGWGGFFYIDRKFLEDNMINVMIFPSSDASESSGK
jgi:C1A family cysteine protease